MQCKCNGQPEFEYRMTAERRRTLPAGLHTEASDGQVGHPPSPRSDERCWERRQKAKVQGETEAYC